MVTHVERSFNISEELERTVVTSLVTSFGLDFLLFNDKKGGDVDTIHNVRQHYNGESDIHLSQDIKNKVANNSAYNSHEYHSHENYIAHGRQDKKLHQAGNLKDNYRNKTMSANDNRQLDHIVSSHEVHNDAGRILAGLDGSTLANQSSNFQSTHGYINNLKSNQTMDTFLNKTVPNTIAKKNEAIIKNQQKLDSMPTGTPQQRNEKQKLENKIKKDKEHVEVLESIDPVQMKKADDCVI